MLINSCLAACHLNSLALKLQATPSFAVQVNGFFHKCTFTQWGWLLFTDVRCFDSHTLKGLPFWHLHHNYILWNVHLESMCQSQACHWRANSCRFLGSFIWMEMGVRHIAIWESWPTLVMNFGVVRVVYKKPAIESNQHERFDKRTSATKTSLRIEHKIHILDLSLFTSYQTH